jgi:tetratricopeptide (TPR) repeat protein
MKIRYHPQQGETSRPLPISPPAEELLKTLDVDPHFGIAYFYLGYPYLQLHRYEEAAAAFQKAEMLTGGMPWAGESIGYALGLSGNSDQARRILGQSEEQKSRRYIPSSALAFLHLGLGDSDGAMELLEKGCEERDPLLPWLKVLPDVDPLRSDARFQDILGRLGLRDSKVPTPIPAGKPARRRSRFSRQR